MGTIAVVPRCVDVHLQVLKLAVEDHRPVVELLSVVGHLDMHRVTCFEGKIDGRRGLGASERSGRDEGLRIVG